MATMQRIGTTATTVTGRTRDRLDVTYHQTVVVSVHGGIVTLNSGGWRTATTKARMNQASNQYGLGFSVYSKAGEWMVDTFGHPGSDDSRVTQYFSDGMQFAI